MTADQQLERSVLESKEREELHAIAQALSVKTNTRTKKADIIDGILKAAGVAVSGTDGDGDASTETRSNGGRGAGATNGASATGSRATQPVQSFGPSDDADRMDAPVDLDEDLIDVVSDDSGSATNGSPDAT